MSTHEEAEIGDLTLDEMISLATGADLPTPGEDYDTRQGWADRLGMHLKSAAFRKLWELLEDNGMLEVRRGRTRRDNHWYRLPLYYSPTLAKKIAERESHSDTM